MAPRPPAPSIFQYYKFADYLTAYMKYRRTSGDRGYSFGLLSRALAVKSSSLLPMIGRGERLPHFDLLQKFCEYAKLTRGETEYAHVLVQYEKAKDSAAKLQFSQRLRELKPLNNQILLDLDTFEMIASWHNWAIMTLAGIKGFRSDPAWISERLGYAISPEKAQESLDLLVRVDVLKRNEAGELSPTAKAFKTPANIPSQAIREFHRQMFDRASKAMDSVPIDARYFCGTTMAIRVSDVAKAAELIIEFRERFRKIIEVENEGEELYHLALQFFPVTEPVAPKVAKSKSKLRA